MKSIEEGKSMLYYRYMKDVGNRGELRLYEDPAEVEFVPLTVSANVDYRNDLVEKLSKVIGMKSYDKLLDIVHSRLLIYKLEK